MNERSLSRKVRRRSAVMKATMVPPRRSGVMTFDQTSCSIYAAMRLPVMPVNETNTVCTRSFIPASPAHSQTDRSSCFLTELPTDHDALLESYHAIWRGRGDGRAGNLAYSNWHTV